MDILPFVIDYWKRFVTHAWVYDNGSTDGSIEYLQEFPWITVEHFETSGMDDDVIKDIKNSCWKNSKGAADFVVVCDIDESLYIKDVNQELQNMIDSGYTVCGPNWSSFISDDMPQYESDKLLH